MLKEFLSKVDITIYRMLLKLDEFLGPWMCKQLLGVSYIIKFSVEIFLVLLKEHYLFICIIDP